MTSWGPQVGTRTLSGVTSVLDDQLLNDRQITYILLYSQ